MPHYITPLDIDGNIVTGRRNGAATLTGRRAENHPEWRLLEERLHHFPLVHTFALRDTSDKTIATVPNQYYDPEAPVINGIAYPTGVPPYWCGHNDYYYRRPLNPRKKIAGKYVPTETPEERASYFEGHADAEERGDQKDYS